MKKKKADRRLSLRKVTIAPLDGGQYIQGGDRPTASCICPPRTYVVNCTLGLCVGQAATYDVTCASCICPPHTYDQTCNCQPA